jgi:hypothetical protein
VIDNFPIFVATAAFEPLLWHSRDTGLAAFKIVGRRVARQWTHRSFSLIRVRVSKSFPMRFFLVTLRAK